MSTSFHSFLQQLQSPSVRSFNNKKSTNIKIHVQKIYKIPHPKKISLATMDLCKSSCDMGGATSSSSTIWVSGWVPHCPLLFPANEPHGTSKNPKIWLYIHVFIGLSISLFIHLFIVIPVFLYLSMSLFIHRFINLCIYSFIYLSMHLFNCSFIYFCFH